MEFEIIIYFIIFIFILYYLLSKSESFEQVSNKKECSNTDINDQLYHYNTINKFVRP